jgi:hypothetical protein
MTLLLNNVTMKTLYKYSKTNEYKINLKEHNNKYYITIKANKNITTLERDNLKEGLKTFKELIK